MYYASVAVSLSVSQEGPIVLDSSFCQNKCSCIGGDCGCTAVAVTGSLSVSQESPVYAFVKVDTSVVGKSAP